MVKAKSPRAYRRTSRPLDIDEETLKEHLRGRNGHLSVHVLVVRNNIDLFINYCPRCYDVHRFAVSPGHAIALRSVVDYGSVKLWGQMKVEYSGFQRKTEDSTPLSRYRAGEFERPEVCRSGHSEDHQSSGSALPDGASPRHRCGC